MIDMSCVLPVTMSKLDGIVEVVGVMFSVIVEGGDWRAGSPLSTRDVHS